jgi:hypothetical protein
MSKFRSGQKVTYKLRTGIYHGKVKHTARYRGDQMAVVSFEGNRWASRVPLHRLQPVLTGHVGHVVHEGEDAAR